MISIITPTIRPSGLEIVATALARQTYNDFEWIVCSPEKPVIEGLKWVKDDFLGGFWSLNRVYNRLIKEARGELLVSWQDYTFANPDVLEKFAYHYANMPHLLVSAVGNKYTSVYPELGTKTWQDPRERNDQGTFYLCHFSDIEWNLCSVPKQAMYDIGGFDEGLDFLGFGMDGYGVNERLSVYGKYDFALDQTIKSFSLGHERVANWEENNLIHGKYQEHIAKLKASQRYPVLNYLS